MVPQNYSERAMRRLLGEYLAMPGLSLTVGQTQRLLALDVGSCQELLGVLARTSCLIRRSDGRYVRPPAVEPAAWRRAVQTVLSQTEGVGALVAAPPPFGHDELELRELAKRPAGAEAVLVSA